MEVWSQEVHTPDGSSPCWMHKLHFLVDGVQSSLWDCCIVIGRAGLREHSALCARFTLPALAALLQRGAPQQQCRPLQQRRQQLQ